MEVAANSITLGVISEPKIDRDHRRPQRPSGRARNNCHALTWRRPSLCGSRRFAGDPFAFMFASLGRTIIAPGRPLYSLGGAGPDRSASRRARASRSLQAGVRSRPAAPSLLRPAERRARLRAEPARGNVRGGGAGKRAESGGASRAPSAALALSHRKVACSSASQPAGEQKPSRPARLHSDSAAPGKVEKTARRPLLSAPREARERQPFAQSTRLVGK